MQGPGPRFAPRHPAPASRHGPLPCVCHHPILSYPVIWGNIGVQVLKCWWGSGQGRAAWAKGSMSGLSTKGSLLVGFSTAQVGTGASLQRGMDPSAMVCLQPALVAPPVPALRWLRRDHRLCGVVGAVGRHRPPITPHSPWGETGTTRHRWVQVVWMSQWVLECGMLCWHQAGQEGTIPYHLRQRGSRTDSVPAPTLLGAFGLAWLPQKGQLYFLRTCSPRSGGVRQGTDLRCPPCPALTLFCTLSS